MDKTRVLFELRSLVDECEQRILPTKWYPEGVICSGYYVNGDLYVAWHTKAVSFLKLIMAEDNDYIRKINEYSRNYYSNAEISVSILKSVIECIEKGFVKLNNKETENPNAELKRIFDRFFQISRQLQSRHESRPTIEINDEYDVQDLLHAILRLFFDDIRQEEWTPSYAGKSARMDFLLKKEKIVIEVKKTRQGLTDKEIGDQLIVDVERYRSHPDCEQLICFVYGPEGRIGNPKGIMKDLNERHAGFATIYIEPNM